MSRKEVRLLTQNPDKLRIARNIFDSFDIGVEGLEVTDPEIQGEDSAEIARFAAQAAHKATGLAVIREDHSFFIDELGIPGPYMAYDDKRVSAEQLVRIVDTLTSRKAHFEIAAAYVDEEGRLYESSYQVPVLIAEEPAGDPNYRWERAMMLPDATTTFAETPGTTRDHLWSGNYTKIAQHIIEIV